MTERRRPRFLVLATLLALGLGAAGTVAGAGPAAAIDGGFLIAGPTTPFPPTVVGEQSVERRFIELRNTGNSALVISAIDVLDPAASFTLEQFCVGHTLAPGAVCGVTAYFHPSAAGPLQAQFSVTHTGLASPTVAAFTGTGLAGRLQATMPDGTSFGQVAVGQSSAGRAVRLENTGDAALTITSATIDAAFDGFVLDDACTGTVLAPGAVCTGLLVRFAPLQPGGDTATVTVEHSGVGGPATVKVSGFALSPPTGTLVTSYEGQPTGFDDVIVGQQSPTRTFRLTNIGDAPVVIGTITVADPDDGFEVTETCAGATVLPDEHCEGVDITFAPTRAGLQAVTVTVAHDGSNPAVVIGMYGTGIAANRPPVADDSTLTTEEEQASAVGLDASDPDGDLLAFDIVDGPDHGSLDGAVPQLTYLPAVDFVGTDSFTYTVDDGRGGLDQATVTIVVTEAPRSTPTLVASTIGIRISRTGVASTLAPEARLTEAGSDAALVGRTLAFRLPNGTPLCTAVTDGTGLARCATNLTNLLRVLLARGYDVDFAGDADRLPATAHGTVVLISRT